MRVAGALFLLAHGVAHLVGFCAAWSLLPPEKMPHVTTIFGGRVDLGETGMRIVGVLWLLAALAFALAAAGTLLRGAWWPRFTLVAASASLALCIAGWPQARIGLIINAAIVIFFAVAIGSGWELGQR